jgi:hypothetical protein
MFTDDLSVPDLRGPKRGSLTVDTQRKQLFDLIFVFVCAKAEHGFMVSVQIVLVDGSRRIFSQDKTD